MRRGDTLGGIAAEHGVSVGELARANGITDPDFVRAGATLVIPGRLGVATYAPPPPGSHRIASGETLSRIGDRYSVTTGVLAAVNGITDPNRITAGAVLTVPWWTCPIPGAWFADDWGAPRPGMRTHEGNDLFAPRGTPVRAPAAGTLSQVRGPVGGLQFRLRGDDGTLYIGTHLDAFGASGRVHVGTVVGYVGTTGNAAGTAPHLHFEIHPAGADPVNPFPTLVAACR